VPSGQRVSWLGGDRSHLPSGGQAGEESSATRVAGAIRVGAVHGVTTERAGGGSRVGGQEATVYVRRGRDLFRITAIGTANPMVDAVALVG
jgi:hypothetical protein